ncbi:hypothetical protein C4K26_3534 [Pseudomonas chlororaphis]|nr:hypothetical protein C4K26_3534 [Pseudomonas chlororaphis]
MLAMVVNDDAGCLTPRIVLRFIASKLRSYRKQLLACHICAIGPQGR